MSNMAIENKNVKLLQSGAPIVVSVNEILGRPVVSSEDWNSFVDSWNDLPTDRYMNDGGTYRQRRFSRFHLNNTTGELRLKEHAPYSQPEHLNPLNGGMLRHFDPCLSSTINLKVFQDILASIGLLLGATDSADDWDINVYQNRTLASADQVGKPVPEGMHRDGVRYSVLLGIRRINVAGAESTVFDDSKTPVATHTVCEGDVLIFCDETSYHDTTPVQLDNPSISAGTRDVMVVEYYHAKGNPNQIFVA